MAAWGEGSCGSRGGGEGKMKEPLTLPWLLTGLEVGGLCVQGLPVEQTAKDGRPFLGSTWCKFKRQGQGLEIGLVSLTSPSPSPLQTQRRKEGWRNEKE